MDGYGKRVLVVEDDEAGRNVLSVLLTRAGYNVIAASDGQEALREMTRRHFDVVVTDYRMPGPDGLEFLSRSRIAWPETPVIMVSGDHPDLSKEPVQRGAYAWLHEPYEPTMLLEIVRDATRVFQDSGAERLSLPAVR